MPDHDFQVRSASAADVDLIAHHRAEMFRDIHGLDDAQCAALLVESRRAIAPLVESGDYLGWLVSPTSEPGHVVGGAGIRLRAALPSVHKQDGQVKVTIGRQGLIVNVFVEREWRRRGVAALVMRHLLGGIEPLGLASIVLHASADGRALYRSLGFVATNEMRYQGPVSSNVRP